jgi:hypothetical protein
MQPGHNKMEIQSNGGGAPAQQNLEEEKGKGDQE